MPVRKFCPFCGEPNRKLRDAPHRKCGACGLHDWRNPAPAVGCALLRASPRGRGRDVLLSRRASPPKKGQWDLVGGFVDAGETPDQAVRREVEEETGCRILGLEPHGAATGEYDSEATLNFLFTGRIEGEPVASDDSAELRWWPLGKVPAIAWPHEAAFVRRLSRTPHLL
ncbi:MAG TPA: NUDIX domain-containing protein [Candidatus Thermoplasmatota archaeon]|nr:NUDIX domain-containing protein [Candidatus Thermoplasmatota archaeon]